MSRAESSFQRSYNWRYIAPSFAVIAAVGMLVGRPFVSRWRERETQLAAARQRVQAQVDAIYGQKIVDSATVQLETMLATQQRRVLRARSEALAASALQSLVLELAEAGNVSITRLNASTADSSGAIPFEVSANSDINGLADLLQRMRVSRYAVNVRKLQVQNNSALRGAPDVLQFSMTLRAPVIVE